jgi:hypothetical protein
MGRRSMGRLFREEDSCTSVKFAAIEERLCQQEPWQLVNFQSRLCPVMIGMLCGRWRLNVVVGIGVRGVVGRGILR